MPEVPRIGTSLLQRLETGTKQPKPRPPTEPGKTTLAAPPKPAHGTIGKFLLLSPPETLFLHAGFRRV